MIVPSRILRISAVLVRTTFHPSIRSPAAARWLTNTSIGALVADETAKNAETVNVVFIQPDGSKRKVDARIGESLLIVAHRHDIELEGACEGVCACSTCHLILPLNVFDTLPEPSEDEEDMLDMAFGLTETSRLGCQIKVTKDLEGVEFEMPKATRNFYVDGHVPKPH